MFVLVVINSMKIKNIPNMGQIIFDEFYNNANIVITDINMSPIRNSQFIKVIDEKMANNLINNHYIYSLFKKRDKYYLYECNPEKLVSHYRYDVYVKYFYVKSYVENKDYNLAKKIYLSHIKAFNNFGEPDGSKNTANDFINNFNVLIVIPCLREQSIIKETIDYFLKLINNNDKIELAIVTTEKEEKYASEYISKSLKLRR